MTWEWAVEDATFGARKHVQRAKWSDGTKTGVTDANSGQPLPEDWRDAVEAIAKITATSSQHLPFSENAFGSCRVLSLARHTHTHTHTYTQSDIHNMGVFPAKRFRASSYNGTMPARYRALLAKHPFALFGLPFTATMVLGSFFLTPATAIRYEKHDRKVKQLTKEEELGIGKDRRRIDLKEEYYVRTLSFMMPLTV
jgi:cytochrome c oxidase assembly protein subunit 16